MNKVILMGRLTRDAEMFGQKSKVARFTLAVDRSYGEDETDFFNCVSFGKQAEFIEKYLKKGTKILLSGRLQNNSYEDKQGNKVTSTQIITEEVEFCESKGTSANNDAQAPSQNGDFMSIPDGMEEELPFN